MNHWTEKLEALNACALAVKWCRTQPDLPTAWAKCKRPDWMLWLAARIGDKRANALSFEFADRAVRVHAATALEHAGMESEVAELRALPEIVDAATAADAARAADAAADAACAADAARAAAYAADAADAERAAACAADAARAAAYAADAAAYAADAERAAACAADAERIYQLARIRETIECPVI